ncbi:hypothetical protein T265_12660, partial [Opisthorchis viverrini]
KVFFYFQIQACSRSTDEHRKKALERVTELGLSGLRTLVYSTRQVTRDEYYSLLRERRQAMKQFGEARVQALNASNERIESGLELLAVTGVEDTLQPGVNECLESLKAAGIKASLKVAYPKASNILLAKMRCCPRLRNKADASIRHVYANGLQSVEPVTLEPADNFVDNRIVSSRYTWWNFIFLNLYEQFHFVSNFTFLSLSFLYLFAQGAISAFAYVVPFLISLFITIVKEGVYDIFRHRRDRRVNNKRFSVLEFDTNNNRLVWTERTASSLRVGQIVRCVADQEIPCDLVLLASDGCKREVRLTTANLDGETSVKTHYAMNKTFKNYGKILSMFPNDMELDDVTQFKPLLVEVTYEAPHADLNRFEGNLITSTSQGTENLVPILIENLVLRGAVVHSTGGILGLVVYTGVDTKLSMNSKKRGRKYSSREDKLNFVLTLFLVTSILLCATGTILATVWNKQRSNVPWFVSARPPTRFSYVRLFISFAFIANFLVPVSLIITIELQMLVNSYLITHDPEFFDPERGLGGSANSVHLADELGQIEFLFSDKTGTLTLNQMVFKACSILCDDGIYVFDGDEVRHLKSESGQPYVRVTEMQQSNVWSVGSALPVHLMEFLTVVALCHTVETRSSADEEDVSFEATSPDEKALVEGAAKYGIVLSSTNRYPEVEGGRRLVLQRNPTNDMNRTTTEEYFVDATVEFDSNRKRMTVLVRHPDGTFHIHSKGAESKLLEVQVSSMVELLCLFSLKTFLSSPLAGSKQVYPLSTS